MKDKIDTRPVPPVDQHLFKRVYSVEDLESCLVGLVTELTEYPAQSYLDYTKEQVEPMVVIAPGAIQPDEQQRGLVSAGYGYQAYPGSTSNDMSYACLLHGVVDLRCVSRSARHARRMADVIGKLMLTLTYYMAELTGLQKFTVAAINEPQKVDDTEHLWYSSVQCRFTLQYAWSTARLSPRLTGTANKPLAFNTLR